MAIKNLQSVAVFGCPRIVVSYSTGYRLFDPNMARKIFALIYVGITYWLRRAVRRDI